MSSLEQEVDIDYYKILGVPKNATIQQICLKYTRLYLDIDK
jgi:curved DNA-binding protein CbpA